MYEWFLAIGLVCSSFSYVFYLGTRWGRYNSDSPPRESQRNAAPPIKSWERRPYAPPAAASDRDFAT